MSDATPKETRTTKPEKAVTAEALDITPSQSKGKIWREKLKQYGAAVLLGIWSGRTKEPLPHAA